MIASGMSAYYACSIRPYFRDCDAPHGGLRCQPGGDRVRREFGNPPKSRGSVRSIPSSTTPVARTRVISFAGEQLPRITLNPDWREHSFRKPDIHENSSDDHDNHHCPAVEHIHTHCDDHHVDSETRSDSYRLSNFDDQCSPRIHLDSWTGLRDRVGEARRWENNRGLGEDALSERIVACRTEQILWPALDMTLQTGTHFW